MRARCVSLVCFSILLLSLQPRRESEEGTYMSELKTYDMEFDREETCPFCGRVYTGER